MICPKCQNEIKITEFSCFRCGLRLPVKNQQERILAEKYAEQIYAEKKATASENIKKEQAHLSANKKMINLNNAKNAVQKGYAATVNAVKPGKKILSAPVIKAKNIIIQNKEKAPRAIVCTKCGASLKAGSDQNVCVCDYCGTSFAIPESETQVNMIRADRIEHVDNVNIHKKGAVESALGFADKQIDRVQGIVERSVAKKEEKERQEEEKRQRVLEEERREEEEAKRIIGIPLTKKNKALILGFGIMGLCLVISIIMMMVEDAKERKIASVSVMAPDTATAFRGRDHEEVIRIFENAGFLDITELELDDLVTGWITKEGEVESVTINGDTQYTKGDYYLPDSKVIITYHVFPEREERDDLHYTVAREDETVSAEEQVIIEENEDPFVPQIQFPVLDGYTILQSFYFWIEEGFTYEYIQSVAEAAGFFTKDDSNEIGKALDISETETIGIGPGNEPYYVYETDHVNVGFSSSGGASFKEYTFKNKRIRVAKYSYDYAGPGHSIIIRGDIPESYERGLEKDIKEYTDLKQAMDFVIGY